MRIILLAALISFASCNWTPTERVEKLTVGMTRKQVTELLGEPIDVQYNSYGTEWYYLYSAKGYKTGLRVTFGDSTVKSFYSY